MNDLRASQTIYSLAKDILEPWGIEYTSAFCARVAILVGTITLQFKFLISC